ncbi:MAG: nitrate reductase molybdenum cofactor assembly chaperone [Phenylobacterium sp.]|jgi:nitrate reductase delta subunit|uniref:nitrate reductase molybdenum cofactor assembly chaperone n=1 Tax=Phenylobacterium sp. TaxID=1871053 RepID=UPI002A2FA762|nr:nitrate reductase molybdenum cofactor assembly chaperone [Phenylobacterium sp.]MDD3838890.1 nitrate reductase molybdenum cofactor assembly chaperone [Phenylobacterium sp.]MDX9997824.1 nitrate reductase molybdenum cofactor assembly chaperone [Phenylobacterium sp.]
MAQTYKALGVLLSYPTPVTQDLAPVALAAVEQEGLVPAGVRRGLAALAREIAEGDLYELQERFVWLFDRTRSLSLNLYEHVHGESRDRGQAMVALLELYRSKGLELSANELPDHLPVFLEFLSCLPEGEAASLLGEAAHVLSAIGERLDKRESAYAAVFEALAALAGEADGEALAAILAEPDDDPDDLETMDKLWAETAVTFGPADVGCPKADAMVRAMQADPKPAPRRAGAAA